MVKKLALAVLAGLVLMSGGLYLWARSVFSHDNVRITLAAELSDALGQPVSVTDVNATIYPRVTVRLGGVAIGAPARIQIGTLDLGTDFRALLSRRIEHATARVEQVRVELPLPPLGSSSTPSPAPPPSETSSRPPVELISIDEVLFRDITLVSGGRTLRADIDAVPYGDGVVLKRVAINADDTSIEAFGEITNLAGPVGTLAIKAGQLDFDRLLAFLNDFSAGSGVVASASRESKTARAVEPNLTVSVAADRAKSGGLVLEKFNGRALVTASGVAIEPMSFGIFGGQYEGALHAKLSGSAPTYRFTAKTSGIDLAALTKYAGGSQSLTGRLAATLDLTGAGLDPAAAMKSARGTARVDVSDGAVKGLQLVRTIVLATSMRGESTAQAFTPNPEGEAFKRLGATLAIAQGLATTDDLSFDSPDVNLRASGAFQLDGSNINLRGAVQLSDTLSQQAGRDLLRYTAQDNRVTLPATVSGSADKISVKLDLADATKRAVTNRAKEEAQKAIQRGIGGLLKRRPR